MADMKKVYDDLIIINLYPCILPFQLNTIFRFEKVKARIYRFSAKHGSKSLCLHKENGSWYIIKKKTKEHCSMGARVINPKNTAFLG